MAEITEQIVREAPEIEAYKVGLLQSAKGLADTPVNLPGYQIAGFNPDQIQSFDMARQGIGAYQPYMQQGAANLGQSAQALQQGAQALQGADTRGQFVGAQQSVGQGAQALQQGIQTLQGADTRNQFQQAQQSVGQGMGTLGTAIGQYDPNSVNAFMNPYQQNVISSAMDEINRQRDLTAQQQSAQAVRSGAFGGSRQAVQSSELERNTGQLRNQTMSNLLAQGYNQAQAAAMTAYEQGQQRNLATGQAYGQMAGLQGNLANQQFGIGRDTATGIGQFGTSLGNLGTQQGNLANQQFGIGQQIASGLNQFGTAMGNLGVQQGAMGESAQRMGQQDVNMLYNVGQQQQALTQQGLDAERNTALQRAYEPHQRLGFVSDIYKGAPSSQQSITAATAPVPSQFQQAVGTGVAVTAAATGAKRAGLFP